MYWKVIHLIKKYIQLAITICLEQRIAMKALTQCCAAHDYGITNVSRLPFC